MTIVLLGATGYTGARTAEAMVRRGLAPVLAGRDQGRLESLARRLGAPSGSSAPCPTARADVTDPSSVRALVDRGDVLVSTVGPFCTLGEPVVQAAIDAGAIYFDSTGEPPFIRRIHEVHGPAATDTGAALIPAFGSDFVPGVLAGAMALRAAGAHVGGDAARVEIGYFISTGATRSTGGAGTASGASPAGPAGKPEAGGRKGQPFSRGTLNSLVGVLSEPVFAWRDGMLRTEPAARRLRTFDVAGRRRPGVSIGSTEHYALPRLAPGLHSVDVYLGWFGALSYPMHYGARLAPLLRPTVPQLTRLVSGWASEEPSAATLARMTSHFLAEVFDRAGTRRASVHLTAPEPYAITAELLAWGAERAATQGANGTGALDPIAAFGLDAMREAAAAAGIGEALAAPGLIEPA